MEQQEIQERLNEIASGMEEYRVVYIARVGEDTNGENIYHFLLSKDPEEVFAEGWSEKPACNINNGILMIDEDMYDYVKELRTEVMLDLAQDNSCYSMQDCRDGIVCLASENIDNADEYPDHRIVIHFGEPIIEVERRLALRELVLRFVQS